MGRSVMVPSDAVKVIYFQFGGIYDDDGNYDEFESQMAWNCMVEDIVWSVGKSHISFAETGYKWACDECWVVTESEFTRVTLSEYCGMCALAFLPVETAPRRVWGKLASKWAEFCTEWINRHINEIEKSLREVGLKLYRRVGSFSNGGSVYREVG